MKLYSAKTTLTASVLSVAAICVAASSAVWSQSRQSDEPYISIYEECGFRGERRDIAVGDFRRMSELDFYDNEISSIKVPRELDAVIFERSNFKGDYARVDRDIRCFDQTWNDQVSSLKVEYRQRGERDRSQNKPRVYGGRGDRNERNNRSRERNRSQEQDQQIHFRDSVNSKNVSQVVFDNRVLQQVNDHQWQIHDRRRGVSQYNEVRRDDSSVYLKNQHTNERVRIDVFVNDVTISGNDRRPQRFAITNRKASQFQARPSTPAARPAANKPNTRIRKDCFNYRAYTNGKTGGVRFLGKEGFHRFQKKAHTGRICHKGVLAMEINKRNFDTDVTIEIDGRRFKFASGEKEDKLHNNWYRKGVKLTVGK